MKQHHPKWSGKGFILRELSSTERYQQDLILFSFIFRSEYERMYNLTALAVQLNEPEEGVAPTDSRLRPDQRLMEEGKWDEANQVKGLLEEKQRSTRRKREEEAATNPEAEVSYAPSWFKLQIDPITNNPVHVYNGDYWQCKQKQDWSRCPVIFNCDKENDLKSVNIY